MNEKETTRTIELPLEPSEHESPIQAHRLEWIENMHTCIFAVMQGERLVDDWYDYEENHMPIIDLIVSGRLNINSGTAQIVGLIEETKHMLEERITRIEKSPNDGEKRIGNIRHAIYGMMQWQRMVLAGYLYGDEVEKMVAGVRLELLK